MPEHGDDNLKAPLSGRSRKKAATAKGKPSRAPLFAAGALSFLLIGFAAILGQANWTGFEPGETTEIAAATDLTSPDITGTVPDGATTVLAIDPDEAARQNELARRTTSGGATIITVDPSSIPDRDISDSIVIRDPSTLGQNTRVAHLPIPDLLETVGGKRLPRIADDGNRPAEAYARPWSGSAGPRIALVIGGLGLSQTGTQDAIRRLPGTVTLGFASAGNSLDRWMQSARRAGHEIIMQVPLEPIDYPRVNPGRGTLTVDASPSENIDRLHDALGRTTNYTGVMNYMGSKFTADADAMAPFVDEIAARGLLYIDDGSSARSLAAPLAAASRVPFAQADRIIDAARSNSAILARLNELEQIARSQGLAIGVGSAFPETVEAVAQWMRGAEKRGIEFVPVSAAALK